MIVDKSGRRTEVLDENGMYVYKMKIKKKGKDDMDLGTVNNKEEAKENESDDEDVF